MGRVNWILGRAFASKSFPFFLLWSPNEELTLAPDRETYAMGLWLFLVEMGLSLELAPSRGPNMVPRTFTSDDKDIYGRAFA